jgi:hypothetical protein
MSRSVFAGGRVLLDGALRRADVVVDGDDDREAHRHTPSWQHL